MGANCSAATTGSPCRMLALHSWESVGCLWRLVMPGGSPRKRRSAPPESPCTSLCCCGAGPLPEHSRLPAAAPLRSRTGKTAPRCPPWIAEAILRHPTPTTCDWGVEPGGREEGREERERSGAADELVRGSVSKVAERKNRGLRPSVQAMQKKERGKRLGFWRGGSQRGT